MPLHHAVLALLAVKPAHGYELKGSFEQAVGDQWDGLNIGHLQVVGNQPGTAQPARIRNRQWLPTAGRVPMPTCPPGNMRVSHGAAVQDRGRCRYAGRADDRGRARHAG
jgi:hypothetical protein